MEKHKHKLQLQHQYKHAREASSAPKARLWMMTTALRSASICSI